MTATKSAPRRRRPQERAEVTKRTLIKVALKEFSERGYDAVTVRDIETLAGVQRNLVRYHFGSKEELWKAAAGFNIEQLEKFTERRGEMMRDIDSTHARISYTIRSFVRFCAQHPELNSMILEEGTQNSWRIEWLVQNHVKRAMMRIRDLVKSDLGLSDEEFINWYYIMVGGGAMIFSVAPEAKLMFGMDTKSTEVVDRHADMLTNMLMMNMQGPPNK